MRTTQKTVLLVALLGAAFAAPASIKNRLGQLNAKSLAQWGGDGGDVGGEEPATCDFGLGSLTLPALPETDCDCAFEIPDSLGGAGGANAGGVGAEFITQE